MCIRDRVKDPKELEELYRRAYHYSQELTGGKPWVLAANNLAVAYLKRDTVDTEVLKPLIDFSVSCLLYTSLFNN